MSQEAQENKRGGGQDRPISSSDSSQSGDFEERECDNEERI